MSRNPMFRFEEFHVPSIPDPKEQMFVAAEGEDSEALLQRAITMLPEKHHIIQRKWYPASEGPSKLVLVYHSKG